MIPHVHVLSTAKFQYNAAFQNYPTHLQLVTILFNFSVLFEGFLINILQIE